MRIVYLDQNKWIELARAAKYPAESRDLLPLLDLLFDEVRARRVAIPLSFANLYETQKINDPQQRRDLALLQSSLSQGLVIRGRYKRLEVELSNFVRAAHGLPALQRPDDWFLSDVFIEATAEIDDERLPPVSEVVRKFIKSRPAVALFDYIVNTPEETRRQAVRWYSERSNQLRLRIEARRRAHGNDTVATRRRIYSALLMIEEIDLILKYGRSAGAQWSSVDDIGSSLARRMMIETPTYFIKRELTLRLEAQNREICENDFRDMQTFCSVLAYADYVVAEKQFSNLAIQSGLGKKYGTKISTDLLSFQRDYSND